MVSNVRRVQPTSPLACTQWSTNVKKSMPVSSMASTKLWANVRRRKAKNSLVSTHQATDFKQWQKEYIQAYMHELCCVRIGWRHRHQATTSWIIQACPLWPRFIGQRPEVSAMRHWSWTTILVVAYTNCSSNIDRGLPASAVACAHHWIIVKLGLPQFPLAYKERSTYTDRCLPT